MQAKASIQIDRAVRFSRTHLEEIIAAVRGIPHVEIIRIGTRVPVVLPMRVDEPAARIMTPIFDSLAFQVVGNADDDDSLFKEECAFEH